MKRIILLILAAAVLFLAACGSPAKHTLTFKTTGGGTCTPRNPPSAGECIAQHFGVKPTATLRFGSTGKQGVDLSIYQGYTPNLTGLSFVIIQANYGLNVEPSVYGQLADAKAHHVPYGCYTFLEPGVSGTAAAQLANRLCPGAPLGLTADAEVTGAYEHACSYTAETKALGRIALLFSYPGGWPYDRPCEGYLYTSEWGVVSYPFGGYPASAVKIHQYDGDGYRYGVRIDLDEDLGILALAKPTPKPTPAILRKKLAADKRFRAILVELEGKHLCRTPRKITPHTQSPTA